MNRLEEIKKKRWRDRKTEAWHECSPLDISWLISEIERIEKEKEWLFEKVLYTGYEVYRTNDDRRELLTEEMQQALKEESDG